MKECELCELPARMYCQSDNASLCWSCDGKVHAANFLVARHSRSLLCQICQAVTAWQASGSSPGPTVSVCEKCVARNKEQDQEKNDENQVVPLASAVSGPPPTSSSTGESRGADSEEDDEDEQSSPLKRSEHALDLYVSEMKADLFGKKDKSLIFLAVEIMSRLVTTGARVLALAIIGPPPAEVVMTMMQPLLESEDQRRGRWRSVLILG
ncbi:zinc finger protein CONSTANS-LIKE 2 isoform X2 [Cryptomeria japonica]|uniref:zinc finger protein CONSTANS-LIKE 2 isoform X2 n=1 Tax=Cryptomeria japonica TaxID=3369 RepID=UPI0025AD8BD5|nr:zinc finger protein CONSTANS-LIKE 2 isoform X2 [Cryptomeria japonica]